MSHFNQPNIERKNCLWTIKYESLSEICIVRHVEMKSVFTFQPIKRLVSTTVKSAQPAATFPIFLLRTKTDNFVVWRDGTHCFARKTSRGYEKKNHLQFWRNFSANDNQANPKPHQKLLK